MRQVRFTLPGASRSRPSGTARLFRLASAAAFALTLAACGTYTQNFNHGYVFDEASLEQVPPGSSQEQVLLVLGTPSTVATVSGEVFYYISQKAERVAFLKPEVVDQRVLAVYFSQDRRVERIANYGLKDGKVFDFISRTTATGGTDQNIIRQILKGAQFTPKI
jgi:outer membrane protein assembly factor BamE (lipoprotein component of BamABCDE complex)